MIRVLICAVTASCKVGTQGRRGFGRQHPLWPVLRRHPPWEADVIIQVTEDKGLSPGNKEERARQRKILLSSSRELMPVTI